jgi:hypothetical protein
MRRVTAEISDALPMATIRRYRGRTSYDATRRLASRPPCGMRLMDQPEAAAPNFWGRIMVGVCFAGALAVSGGDAKP